MPTSLSGYDTYIIIDLKDGVMKDVQRQINNEVNKEVLLFLNNLEKITIESPERNLIIDKINLDKDSILIKLLGDDGIILEEKKWNVKCRNGEHDSNNYELKIAWNDKLDDNIKRIYSYFITKVKFPFPALIHGTFELSTNRDNLINDTAGHNKFLVNELIQLLIDTALEISKSEVSYNPLKLLNIYENEAIDPFFEENNFGALLIEKIKVNKLFPTVNDEYICYKEKPVFYKNNYAAILPSNEFEDLLLFSRDNSIIKTIEKLGRFKYNYEYFFKKISQVSNKFSLKNRAQLVKYIIEDYGDVNITNDILPNIFIDQNGEIIPSNSEIFLPSSGEKIDIPITLNLKIMHSDLFSELKSVFNIESAEILESRLRFLKVKAYRFGEILRKIISHFNNQIDNDKQNQKNIIRKLIKNLCSLYVSNKDKQGIDIIVPSNITILLITKYGELRKVSELYTGEEYANYLCESLFEYNKNYLVGSPSTLGLENEVNVKEFLLWLGVAEYPRRKLIDVDNKDYNEFVLKNYPYGNVNIYPRDSTITSYKKLKEKTFYVNGVRVETIIDIENILKNNSIERIIFWIRKDKNLLETINNGTENNYNSEFKINIRPKWTSATIQYLYIKSFILWQFQNIDWIFTKSNKYVNPKICSLSKTITKEFSPFIEIPEIYYNHPLFIDAKISNQDVNYYLSKLGINKDISNFSTDTIYSILLNLKDRDPNGSKAKLLYNEIIENLDESNLDKSSVKYQEFIKGGYVSCKLNNVQSFQKISNVYYVENKTLGQNIIDQFYTIDIGIRKGNKKINTIFGVKALDKLDITLKNEPKYHLLNQVFQNEVDDLKPYIYSFRLQKDTNEYELNLIRRSNIYLCVSIEAKYIHNNIGKDFYLRPYEFIYIEKKNQVFLLIGNEIMYNTISDLRNDYKLSDVFAEIYSSILKVELHRRNFSELFYADPKRRDYIIERELDDQECTTLKKSREKLHHVENSKIKFWFTVLNAKKIDIKNIEFKDIELQKFIIDKLKINIPDYCLNYDDLNNITNIPIIIELFKLLEIDILDFNNSSTIFLDIRKYFRDLLRNKINSKQTDFEIGLYHSYIRQSIDKKKDFINKIHKYESFQDFGVSNSIKTDLDYIFPNTIKNEFGIDITIKYDRFDLQNLYRQNLEKLKIEITKGNKEIKEEILSEILLESENASCIYFEEFDEIIKEYERLIVKEVNKKEINFNNKNHQIDKDDYSSLYKFISEEDPITDTEEINAVKPVITVDPGTEKGKRKKHLHRNKDKEIIGCIGEIIVFETLKNQYGKDNVIWDSEYAKKANVNSKGNDNKHYDIKYKAGEDKWKYVEVKASVSSILEFTISNGEVNFGEEYKDNYEIMIVTNILGDKKYRRIKKIISPFVFIDGESFTSNSKFIVKNENFIIGLDEGLSEF